MQFTVPDILPTLEKMQRVDSTFNGVNQNIGSWVLDIRKEIKDNRKLLQREKNEIPSENDFAILRIFLRDFLVRAVRGEAGEALNVQLQSLKTVADLNMDNYRGILARANYRWGPDCGAEVMQGIVNVIAEQYKWNWVEYIDTAEREKANNYADDPMLRIRNVGFKLRDLALSNFSPYYAAFDLHVTRVMTRLGWLNYGFSTLCNQNHEMGNNPANRSNYLFMHGLMVSLTSKIEKNEEKYCPVDFDRIFWHFGRTVCRNNPNCNICEIKDCPTGIARNCNK